MSWEAQAWAWEQKAGSTGAKILLMALAQRADEFGVTYVGRRDLAERCECDPATISRNLQRLSDAGLVELISRRRQNGSYTSNFTVLAPLHGERGTMLDCPEGDQYPDEISRVAKRHVVNHDVANRHSPCADLQLPEQTEEQTDKTPPTPPDDVQVVFDRWRLIMKHPGAQLDDKRRRLIAKALTFATVDECAAAIVGCSASDYHMATGQYKGGTRYDHLSLILRNRENIERFSAMAPQNRGGVVDMSGGDAKIREAMKAVLLAHDLAGNGEAHRKGDEAEALLVERGWRVIREDGARPRFERQ